jgi:hypothetical protein
MRYRATSLQLLELSCSDMIMVDTYLDPAGNCDNCTAVKMRGICQKKSFCCCPASNLVEDAGASIYLLMFSMAHE